MIDSYTTTSWDAVLRVLRQQSEGTTLRIPKHAVEHPEDRGASRSLGLPVGQIADFRWRLSNCAGFHVRDFGTHYEAHIDRIDPSCSPIDHLREDAPGTYVAGTVALGALIGLILGRNKDAVVVGAAIGAIIGAATLPDGERN